MNPELDSLDFTLVYIEGVRLANAERATLEKIAEGEAPPLSETDRENLDTLLQLHGTFMLCTASGVELIEAEQQYQRRASEEREYRAAAVELVRSFQKKPNIINPGTASVVLGAAEQIGHGANPERSGVAATSAILNLTITLTAAASVAALPIIGGAVGGAGGLIAGGLAGLMASESLKKSRPFAAVIGPIVAKLDTAAQTDFTKFKEFFLSVEPLMRLMPRYNERFSWLSGALSWMKGGEDVFAQNIDQDASEPKSMRVGEESDRIRIAFLATMSLRLRTGLNSIIGFTEVLANNLAGPLKTSKALRNIDIIKNEGQNISEIIYGLSDMASRNMRGISDPDIRESIAILRISLRSIIRSATNLNNEIGGSAAKTGEYPKDIITAAERMLFEIDEALKD